MATSLAVSIYHESTRSTIHDDARIFGSLPVDVGVLDAVAEAGERGRMTIPVAWPASFMFEETLSRIGHPIIGRVRAAITMHACGHDVHMTCGLGILEQVLSRPQRNSFVFFFQPAEENISGAQQVCDAGLLDKYGISEFYALHVSPEWDAGVIATRPGTLLAGSSSVTVQFTGVAGHAGMPHRAVDPIVSVAAFIMQIQAMIARNFDPAVGGVVLTFGTVSGGTVVNGVAASAKVMGTLRFLDPDQHDLAFKRISEIAEGVALATGATADVQLEDSPWVPVSNDPGITARFTDYVHNRPGAAFEDAPVTMASEDYGYLLSHIPGMMFWLGTGRGHPLHSEMFSPDERAIEPAVRLIGDYLTQL